MFRKSDAEKRELAEQFIKQAEELCLSEESLESVNNILKKAISLRWLVLKITHDDYRKIAEYHVAMASNIRMVYDEGAEDEFETRTSHPDFYTHMKLAIHAIDNIPFDKQTRDDLENVDIWYCDISTNYHYFRIPEEWVMDDNFLRITSKYFAKKTVVDTQEKLEELIASNKIQRG